MTRYIWQDLPLINDGNSHNFFCVLRLVVDGQATDQQKLFPQSARTRCVKPLVSDMEYQNKGIAKWNEIFIFEVPRKVCFVFVVFAYYCYSRHGLVCGLQ